MVTPQQHLEVELDIWAVPASHQDEMRESLRALVNDGWDFGPGLERPIQFEARVIAFRQAYRIDAASFDRVISLFHELSPAQRRQFWQAPVRLPRQRGRDIQQTCSV